MARYIDADKLIAEYDRVHIGAPGGARKLMVDAPTCNVVPKSEVERLTVELDAMRGAANSYKMNYEKAKSEVAREIFEEIEKLHLHITNEFDLRRYEELKKKYTEGETNGNNAGTEI